MDIKRRYDLLASAYKDNNMHELGKHSDHQIVVEYAIQMCFKGKSVKKAAELTRQKLGGHPNLFIESGSETVFIEEEKLEKEIWNRIARYAVKISTNYRDGMERVVLEHTLANFNQKVNLKNMAKLASLVEVIKTSS